MASKSNNTDKAITAGKVLQVTSMNGDSGFFYIGYKAEVNNAAGFVLYPMALHGDASPVPDGEESLIVSLKLPREDDFLIKPVSVGKSQELRSYAIDFSKPIHVVDLLKNDLNIEVLNLDTKNVQAAVAKLAWLRSIEDKHVFSAEKGLHYSSVDYSNLVGKYLGHAAPPGKDSFRAEDVVSLPVEEVVPVVEKAPPIKRRLTAVPLADRKRPSSPSVVSSPSHSDFRLQDLFLYSHAQKIDKKGRVSMPSEFRSAAGGDIEFALVKHPHRPLLVGSSAQRFLQIVSQDQDLSLNTLARNTIRVEFDESGRTVFPIAVCDSLGLEKGKGGILSFLGRGTFFEVCVEGQEELSREEVSYDDDISKQIEHMRWDI